MAELTKNAAADGGDKSPNRRHGYQNPSPFEEGRAGMGVAAHPPLSA